ncbi:MAG: hypothetical protein D6690_10650 [Nitrospirae bacterium]|nr:MAG: hypothetical protein D6690_10650 [Nitrospirota bacterium]
MEVLRLIELDKIDPFGLKLYRVKGPFFDTLARVRNGLLGTEKASFCCASYDPDGHGYFYVSNIDGANKGGWQAHIQHIYTSDDRALPHLRTSLTRNPSNPDYSSVLDTLAFDCEADTRICFQFGAKASGYVNPRVVAPAPVNVRGQISRMPTWHGQYLYWSANYQTASGETGMMIKRAVIKGFDTRTNMLEFGPAEEVVKTKRPGLIGFGEPSLTDNGDLYAAAASIDPATGHVNIVPVVFYQR